MADLTASERAFLAYNWRWAESKNDAIKVRYPGAREAEYQSAFVTIAGATAALNIISAATTTNRRLVSVTCDGILPVTFRGRPSTVRLRTERFGIGTTPGRLMLLEQYAVDYGRKVTTLYLAG